MIKILNQFIQTYDIFKSFIDFIIFIASIWFNMFIKLATFLYENIFFEFLAPQWTTGACSEQNMVDCEMKAMYFLHAVNESDDGYNHFCE